MLSKIKPANAGDSIKPREAVRRIARAHEVGDSLVSDARFTGLYTLSALREGCGFAFTLGYILVTRFAGSIRKFFSRFL